MADPLLEYDAVTDPDPLESGGTSGNPEPAQLAIVVTNPQPTQPVTLQGLSVQIPVGTDGDDLTNDASLIAPIPADGWTLQQTDYPTGFVRFIFWPTGGQATVGGDSLRFVFNNIDVNQQVGEVHVLITEGSGNCVPPDCPTTTIPIVKYPHGWSSVLFWTTPQPPILEPGESLSLHWNGPSGATYEIDYYITSESRTVHVPAEGDPPLANAGQYPATDAPALRADLEPTTFYLTVTATIDGRTKTTEPELTTTIAWQSPTISQFEAQIDMSGDAPALVLTWDCLSTRACVLSTEPEVEWPARKTLRVPVTADNPLAYAYTLTALGHGDDQTATATLTTQWQASSRVRMPKAPNFVAISPSGDRLYVALWDDRDGDGDRMISIDTRSHEILASASVARPSGIAVSRDGTRVFVTSAGSPSAIAAIEAAGWVVTSVPVATPPAGIAMPERGDDVMYVSMRMAQHVLKLDAATLEVIGTPYGVGQTPYRIAVSASGSRAYVANENSSTISIIETATGEIQSLPIEDATLIGVACAPDDRTAYAADFSNNVVVVIDTRSTPARIAQVLSNPDVDGFGWALAAARDGTQLFVTANSMSGPGTLVVLDTTAPIVRVAQNLPLMDTYPNDIAVSPDSLAVYVANMTSKTIGIFTPTLVRTV